MWKRLALAGSGRDWTTSERTIDASTSTISAGTQSVTLFTAPRASFRTSNGFGGILSQQG